MHRGKRWLESTSEDDPSIDTSMSISFSMSSRVISRSATGDEGTLFGRRSSGGGKDKTEGMNSLGSLQKTAMSNWLLAMQVGGSNGVKFAGGWSCLRGWVCSTH